MARLGEFTTPTVTKECRSCGREKTHATRTLENGERIPRSECVECSRPKTARRTRKNWRRKGPVERAYAFMLQRASWRRLGKNVRPTSDKWVVDESWLGDGGIDRFAAAIGPYPSDGQRYTVDRIDNAGGYRPGNVRWATFQAQARNRTSTVLLTHEGSTRPMSEWSDVTGIKLKTIWKRINEYGWSVDRALTQPPRFA